METARREHLAANILLSAIKMVFLTIVLAFISIWSYREGGFLLSAFYLLATIVFAALGFYATTLFARRYAESIGKR
jgi:uncharacterized RDD family membrane protein YckC